MSHTTYHFVEFKKVEYEDELGYPVLYTDTNTYAVSTRKVEEFKKNSPYEWRYVESIVEKAMNGKFFDCTSKKFSFSDTPEWFESLKPDADCTDPVVEITYELV